MYVPIVWNLVIKDVDEMMIGQKAGFKWVNLMNAQENVLAEWKRFLYNDVGTQKARIWRTPGHLKQVICRILGTVR